MKIKESLTAVVYKEEDMFIAECPEAGTVSQGKTADEAIANLKEATELYLEEFPLKEKRRTWMTTFEVAASAKAMPLPYLIKQIPEFHQDSRAEPVF